MNLYKTVTLMDNQNFDLSIEFVTMSGETKHKTSNLNELRQLYVSWTDIFMVKITHTYDYRNYEDPDVYYSDTNFVFNEISFNCFNYLIYYILTESTIGSNNIVTVVKSSENIYEFKGLYEDDSLHFGIGSYLRRL